MYRGAWLVLPEDTVTEVEPLQPALVKPGSIVPPAPPVQMPSSAPLVIIATSCRANQPHVHQERLVINPDCLR